MAITINQSHSTKVELPNNSLSYCCDSDRHFFIQREGSFLTYTRNREEHHNIVVVKSTLKIPPRHNGAIPIRIFISNQHTKKGLNPNIHVIDSIYNIKGKLTLHIIVANYTNKHINFNKGQCIGHMEPPINNIPQTPVNSVITQKMMAKQVQLDTFIYLSSEVKQSLHKLLESFKSQFVKD